MEESPNLTNPSAQKLLILAMGDSGTGKTTFINLLTGANHPASDSLEPDTTKVGPGDDCEVDGQIYSLIDTPGLDHPPSNEDVFKMLRQFLRGREVYGILYFHKIDNPRASNEVGIFQEMKTFHGVSLQKCAIVTTFWDEIDKDTGSMREQELKIRSFTSVLSEGATMLRHDNTLQSARAVISTLGGTKSMIPGERIHPIEAGSSFLGSVPGPPAGGGGGGIRQYPGGQDQSQSEHPLHSSSTDDRSYKPGAVDSSMQGRDTIQIQPDARQSSSDLEGYVYAGLLEDEAPLPGDSPGLDLSLQLPNPNIHPPQEGSESVSDLLTGRARAYDQHMRVTVPTQLAPIPGRGAGGTSQHPRGQHKPPAPSTPFVSDQSHTHPTRDTTPTNSAGCCSECCSRCAIQ